MSSIIPWIIAIIAVLVGIGAVIALIMKRKNNKKREDTLIKVGESINNDKKRKEIIKIATEQIEKNKEIIKKNKKVIASSKNAINNNQ